MLMLIVISCLALPMSLQETSALGHPEFTLTPSPYQEVVKGLTKDVKLRCEHTGSGKTRFKEIIVMRIERNETDGSWEHLAIIRDSQEVTVEGGKVSGNGVITQEITGSYIEVTWSTAVTDTIGVFKCNIVGFDDDLNAITEITPVTEIKAKPVSASVIFEMFLQEKQNTNRTLYQLKREMMEAKNETVKLRQDVEEGDNELKHELDQIARELRKETNESRQEVDNEILDIKTNDILLHLGVDGNTAKLDDNIGKIDDNTGKLDNITDKLDDLTKELQSLNNHFHSEWPEGSFGLFKPASGCPNDPAFDFGSTEYFSFHAETSNASSPQSTISEGNHVQKLISMRLYGVNWLFLRFCFVSLQNMRSTKWPSGKYCLQRDATAFCPSGSRDGFFYVTEEKEDSQSFKSGAQLGPGKGFLYFCCVTSGYYDAPIDLPTQSPFYLYRYGGHCQKVVGMTVTEEFIEIDTENDNNMDEVGGSHPDATVDRSIGRLRFELCYYS